MNEITKADKVTLISLYIAIFSSIGSLIEEFIKSRSLSLFCKLFSLVAGILSLVTFYIKNRKESRKTNDAFRQKKQPLYYYAFIAMIPCITVVFQFDLFIGVICSIGILLLLTIPYFKYRKEKMQSTKITRVTNYIVVAITLISTIMAFYNWTLRMYVSDYDENVPFLYKVLNVFKAQLPLNYLLIPLVIIRIFSFLLCYIGSGRTYKTLFKIDVWFTCSLIFDFIFIWLCGGNVGVVTNDRGAGMPFIIAWAIAFSIALFFYLIFYILLKCLFDDFKDKSKTQENN